MPTPIVTLPKVANYLKNVGKSVKLVSIDYLKDIAPNTSEFLETNEDLFKEIYSATRNYKDTIKGAQTSMKNSKVYEAASTLRSSLLEDLKTGKWYNKEREDALGAKALDMDFDFDDDEFDMSSFTFDDEDDSDAAKTSRAFDMAMEASTKAQAKISVRSADMISETVKASTSALFAQQERMIGQMTSGLGSVYNAIENVKNFLDQPLMTSLQNTKVFQEKSMEHYNKMESMMDELLQMQRNLYNAEREERKNSDYSNVVGFEGFPDLREYAKAIFKNTKSALGPEFDMLFGDSFGENANPLLMLVASPMKMIPELIVKTVVPVTVKKAAETLDETISGVFTTVLARLNKWATGEDGTIKQWIGRVFGLKLDEKEKPNTGNFKKGPIPFDGITKQAIVEVIPGHLRRIEAALTGQSERLYDMSNGKWTNIKAVEKDFKDRQEAAIRMSFYDIRKDFDEAIRQMKKEDQDRYTDALETVMKKVYEDYGYFNPYRPVKDPILGEKNSAADYYDIDDKTFENLVKLLTRNRKGMMGLARRTLSERESFSSFIRDIEEDPSSIYRNLFNGQYDVATSRDTKYDANSKASPFKNFLTAAVDNHGKDIFFYLQGIYGELLARRRNGGSGAPSTGGKRPAASVRARISPEEALNEVLNKNVVKIASDMDKEPDATLSDDEIISNQYLKQRLEEEKKKEDKINRGNLLKGEDTFVNQMLKAGNLGEKWKVVQANIGALLNKPSLALTSLLEKADARIYTLLFGKEEMAKIEEEFDRSPKGILDYITLKLQETFTNMNDWLDDHIFEPLKKKLGVESVGDFFKLLAQKMGIYEPLKKAGNWVKDKIRWEDLRGAIKSKVKFGASQVKGSLGRTWGRAGGAFMNAVNDALMSGAITQEEADQMISNFTTEDEFDYEDSDEEYVPKTTLASNAPDYEDEFSEDARGRFVTKRGLAVVSPGETIIPATLNKIWQDKQLAKEKAYAKKFNLKNIKLKARGGTINDKQTDSSTGAAKTTNLNDTDAIKNTVKKVMKEIDPGSGIVDIVANSLIGGGVSLITGMIGGPILGAAAGAAISVTKQSKTMQEFLFGTELQDGTRADNGKIPKSVQDAFKKYFPDVKDFGIAGAVAGLFTPLGLVGGLMAGGAFGYLKNNEKVQQVLFGKMADPNDPTSRDGGLISKELREKLKKAAPRMLGGAAGAALFGPFGLLGNVILGSALGYASTTEGFHKFIFGEEKNGKRVGGVVGGIKEGLVKPIIAAGKKLYDDVYKWFDEKILKPLKDFANPFMQMIKNAINDISDSIKGYFKETIGRPISDFIHHSVLEPLGRTLSTILKGPAALAKFIIQTPFQALGFIGNNMTMSQIRRGRATNMTAAERVNWRKEHPYRTMSPTRILQNDRYGRVDRMLATQFEGKKGIDQLKDMRDSLQLALSTKKTLGTRINKMIIDAGQKISDFLNEKTMEDKDGTTVSIYSYVRSGPVKKIHKAIANGDLDSALKEIRTGRFKDVPADIIDELAKLLTVLIPPIQKAIYQKEHALDTEAAARKSIANTFKWGGKVSRKDMANLLRNVNAEIDARSGKDTDKSEREQIADNMSDKMKKTMETQADRLVKVLEEIRDYLAPVNEEAKKKDTKRYIDNDDTEDEYDYEDDSDYEESVDRKEQEEVEQYPTTQARKGFIRRTLGRGIRNVKWGAGKVKDFIGVGDFTKSFKEGQSQIEDKLSEGKTVHGMVADKVKSIGGMLIGKKADVVKALNGAFQLKTGPNGATALADASGELIGDQARSVEDAEKKEKDKSDEIAEAVKSTSKSLFGIAGGILGKGWEIGKSAVGGLLGMVDNLINTNPITSFIASLAKGLIFASVAGHLAKLFTEVLWKPILKPWWENTAWPALKSLGSNIVNFLSEAFPQLSGFLNNISTAVNDFFSGGFESIFSNIKDWFVSGLYNFWDYIAEPLGDLIYNTIKRISWKDLIFGNGERETEETKIQKTDENGNKLYVDSEGNTTTSATDSNGNENKKLMTTQSRTTTNYKSGIINTIFNEGRKQKITAKINGVSHTLIEYDSGKVIISNDETGEYITLNKGSKSSTIKIGSPLDGEGKPTGGGTIAAIIIGGFVGKMGGKALGSAAGTFIAPAIGTAIGAVVGTVAGAAIGGLIYNLANGGSSAELEYNINSVEAIQAMAEMGWGGSVSSWPSLNNGEESVYSQDSSNRGAGFGTTSGSNSSSGFSTGTRGGGFGSNSGKGRFKGFGRGHIYQKAADIANEKFGNSTIGEAGCGPVAATNLINNLGGDMDVKTAAKYAEKGGFVDSSGGTTTEYFNSILNSSGIGATDSTDPLSVYNSLQQGNPAVLLGNSGSRGGQTPFGSGDHYITAMGTDSRGNIIAEDPDLPQSTVTYKANEVLRDMDSAIIAGSGRGRRRGGKRRRHLFGRARSGKAYNSETKVEYPAWVVRAYSVIYSSEGGYNSVNANDSGAMSIGRLQWNAGNAKIVLQKIFTAMIQSGEYSQDYIVGAVGQSLYNDVMGSASFAKRVATGTEKSGLQKVLDNDISKAVQDAEAMDRIYNNYYNTYIKKRGFDPSSQENVVIYCCDMLNQRPASATSVMDAAIKKAGSVSAVSLDLIYQVSLQDSVFGKSQYRDRRTKAYELISGTSVAGTSMQSYTSYDIHDAVQESDDTVSSVASLASGAIKEVFRSIYGDKIASMFGITSTDASSIEGSNSSLSGDGYNAQVINFAGDTKEGQKAVVNKMNSIYGKIKYSLGGTQDPDKGLASCASTVGWAYRKALGVDGMSPSSTTQSKDNRFTTIYTKNSANQMLDTSILKPGDVIYFNWDRENAANNGTMKHTEMYASDGKDLSHGGNPEYGPVYKDLGDYRRKTAMMVRRYNQFIGSGKSRRSGKALAANANRYLTSTVPSTDYGNSANYSELINRARVVPSSGSVSYEEFLNVIIELLVILAKNSDKQISIIQALKKNNINVEPSEINLAGSSRSGKERLKEKLRSGFGRKKFDGRVNPNSIGDNDTGDLGYIVSMMEALAKD